jgi:predicted ATP-grasp superfamily ATP-dependent carboligase
MAAAVADIVERHDVELTLIVGSMPMPAPHTRPVVVSRWASRSELLPGNKPLFGTILMSSAFPLMLGQRLGEADHDVIGLTAHVPHYLADTDFPDAAIALIASIEDVAKLKIPTIQLAVAAGVVRAQIGHQVSESDELGEHVEQLEQSYDEFHRQRELSAAAENLPSADEIGEAAEEFLKTLGEDATEGPAAPTDDPDASASGDDATPAQ